MTPEEIVGAGAGLDQMRRRIARAIKGDILSEVQAGEWVADLAEQYAVSSGTIYGWLGQDSGEAVVSLLPYHTLKGENEELKKPKALTCQLTATG